MATKSKSRKPAAKPALAEPSGTAVVHHHPNVIAVVYSDGDVEDYPLTGETPADYPAQLVAEIEADGWKCETRRYDSAGRVVPATPA